MNLGCSRAAWLLAFAGLVLFAPAATAQTGGDYDGDGDVDGDDFWYWASCMTGPAGSLPDPSCAAFDFTLSRGDGKVDLADLAAFGQVFTGPSCTYGYKYAHVTKPGSATGCSASIRTRATTLCGEPYSSLPAHSAAYAGVTRNEGREPAKWAQTGHIRRRVDGQTAAVFRVYAETKAGPNFPADYDFKFYDDPLPEGTYQYDCYLMSPLFGTWTFQFDGNLWHEFTHNGWKNVTGTGYTWSAELLNKEDQMVGTAAAKCDFTNCMYALDWGMFQYADITSDSTYSDDPNEWGIERTSGTAFRVWDKNP